MAKRYTRKKRNKRGRGRRGGERRGKTTGGGEERGERDGAQESMSYFPILEEGEGPEETGTGRRGTERREGGMGMGTEGSGHKESCGVVEDGEEEHGESRGD